MTWGQPILGISASDVKLDFPRVELREAIFAVLTALIAWWHAMQSRAADNDRFAFDERIAEREHEAGAPRARA